jgi:2-oxoglutarate ferredoxin oxidoreductase subunit beta
MHKGFALIDILQPCVSFNHRNTYAWYKERVYKLEDEHDYDPYDKVIAFKKALEWGDKIPIGIIYRREMPTFEEMLPGLSKGPLAAHKLKPGIVGPLLDEFI